MLTCFIKNNFNETMFDIAVYSVNVIPMIYVLYSVYAFAWVFRRRKIQENNENKLLIFKYLIYGGMYIVFYFPTIILYLITINKKMTANTIYSWFAWYCTLANIGINPILSILRIFEGYVKCTWKAFCIHKPFDESLLTENEDNESNINSNNTNNNNTNNYFNDHSMSNSTINRRSSTRLTSFQKFRSQNKLSVKINYLINLLY
jgi:hypothetical protein